MPDGRVEGHWAPEILRTTLDLGGGSKTFSILYLEGVGMEKAMIAWKHNALNQPNSAKFWPAIF